ncbi:MAG: roadblock/LC7 domain-containing protein [Promethearchaeota archaeon]
MSGGLELTLSHMIEKVPGFIGAVLFDDQGLTVASTPRLPIEDITLGAFTAKMIVDSSAVVNKIGKGTLMTVNLETTHEMIFFKSIKTEKGTNLVLTILADKNVLLGLAFLEIKKSVEILLKIL